MTLLVAAGLLLRSFVGVAQIETGFDPQRTLSFEVVMPGEYAAERRIAAAEQLIARLRAHPQVTSVGFTSAPPLQPGLNLPGGVPVLPPPRAPRFARRRKTVRGGNYARRRAS
jgi:hypothetical protein